MAGAGGIEAGSGVVVIMDPAPVVYLKVFHTGSGPDRTARANARKVAIMAEALAPTATGRLKASIHASQSRNERGRFTFGYDVVADVPYAYYVHEGTGPSPRWPNSRKVMHWHGRQGDFPYRDFVMHPGTPAVPFLRDALVAMVV
jgi:hypothetical protein